MSVKHSTKHEAIGWSPDEFDPRFQHCRVMGCKAVRHTDAPPQSAPDNDKKGKK